MDVIPQKYIIKTKFILVFFCFVQFFNCKNEEVLTNVDIVYENNKALQVSFSAFKNSENIKIYLKGNTDTPVLGEIKEANDIKMFIPVVPFANGKTYEIKYQDQLLKTFTVKELADNLKPELLAVYPTKDTVPENLLKMYFLFSKPMQEVKSALEFIKVTDIAKQQEVPVFLELQTELWNKEHTQLTLWLDPGRIKTDLIPNKELGLPIVNGNTYSINVSKEFKDANGKPLKEDYTKTIIVKERDSKSPEVTNWRVKTPVTDTQNALTIDFGEPLDYALAPETIKVMDSENKIVEGKFTLHKYETVLHFKPSSNWEKGNYSILVESKLEDLAGNNLNHLFDRDLNIETNKKENSKVKSIQFSIK